ncbi:MAG: hypothetical protein V4614_12655 [Pseudomonadota bacterium]
MATKKSLYEILEVPREASYAEIRESHQRLQQALETQRTVLGADDFNLKARLLRVAMDTLASPMTRDAYDAQLINREMQARPGLALLPLNTGPDAEAAKLKADALMLKAEAMSLRADALGMKADMVTHGGSGNRGLARHAPVMEAPTVGNRFASTVKNVLLTLGTLVALSMVIKVALLFWVTRSPGESALAKQQAAEKLYLQEYYQAKGIRPASRAEADLLDAEERRKAAEKSKLSDAEQEQRKTAQAERDFQNESRRRAEQVTAELQYADQRAQQLKREDEYKERYQKEQELRAVQEAERKREADQDKWRRIITTPARN